MPPTWSQRPDAAAQARISTGAGHLVVGVFSPLLTGPYFGEVTKGIVEEVEKCGGSTICVQSLNLTVGGYRGSFSEALAREEGAGELTGLAQFGWEHMHCAISIVKAMSPELLLAWQETGKPLVIVSNDVPGARFTAKPDNATGISQAVAHLVQHGRRRIAFAGYMGQGDIVERYEAYRAALAAHGLALDPALVVEASDNAVTGGEAALAQLLGRGAKVDAVLAATDLNAIAMLEGLKAAGFRVPEDIAVVGFDDAAAASACDPPLTTVCPRFEQLGRLAASLVVKAVRGEPTQAGLHLVETDLVVRRSCGCDPVWPQRSRHQSSTVSFRAGLEDFDAGLAMLCGEQDPSALEWLDRSGVVAACLALWHRGLNGEPVPVLEAGGTFNLSPAPLGAWTAGQFPPAEILAAAAQGQATHLLPVRTTRNDWGVLALVAPVQHESGPVNEVYYKWAALLAIALDRQAILASLEQQRGELAQSWEGERELAEAVQVSEDRYALAAQATNDGLWDWDLGQDQVYYSARWAEMMGLGSDPITADIGCWLQRVHPRDRPALEATLTASKSRPRRRSFELELRVLGEGDSYRWVACRAVVVLGPDGQTRRIVGSLADVTARKDLEQRLRHQALYDALTDLPNRELLQDRLYQAIAHHQRDNSHDFAVLLVDLDYFKVVNDNMGHAAGDQLLREVARRMVSHLRQADTVARMGGDEFVVLVDGLPDAPGYLEKLVQRLQGALQSPFVIVGKEITVSGTVGVVASGATYGSADEILRDADVAMYQAKQCERGSCARFDASMRATAGDRLQTGTDLRHAIADNQLVLYYQPIVDLATRQLAGLEALVRWPRAGFGVVQPGDFLPVATEIGLITQIGREVVSQACRQLAGWHWAGLLGPRVRVSVNVSHWEFWHASFISSLEEILVASGADPEHLAIEVTEGVILHDTAAAIAIVQQLRQRGIAVFLDGFSPGRSSLEGTRDLPVDGIKLERGFPVGLGANRRGLAMAKTVVRACRELGLDLVAEGIETEAEAQQLRSIGCHLGQGYWLAMPMPADEVRDLLGDERPAPILG